MEGHHAYPRGDGQERFLQHRERSVPGVQLARGRRRRLGRRGLGRRGGRRILEPPSGPRLGRECSPSPLRGRATTPRTTRTRDTRSFRSRSRSRARPARQRTRPSRARRGAPGALTSEHVGTEKHNPAERQSSFHNPGHGSELHIARYARHRIPSHRPARRDPSFPGVASRPAPRRPRRPRSSPVG